MRWFTIGSTLLAIKRMRPRAPAIPDEVLWREAHALSDDVRLLPRQVIVIAGLSEGQLTERRRLDPPPAPLPMPKDPLNPGIWYRLGTLRAYNAELNEMAEVEAELTRRGKAERELRFSAWLGTPNVSTLWPFALCGPHKRPVDIWATIRQEVVMRRSDTTAWFTVGEFLDARQKAAVAEQRAEDRKAAVATTKKRVKRAGTVKTSATARERARS